MRKPDPRTDEACLNEAAKVLLRRLSQYASLSPSEVDLACAVARAPLWHASGTQLCAGGAFCPPRLIVSGWACRQHASTDGRRQVASFLLPGDLIGQVLRPNLACPYEAVALTPVETVDGQPLLDGPSVRPPASPGLLAAMQHIDRLNERLLTNQVTRLGRLAPPQRLLHLLLELRDRLREVGLAQRDRFAAPLTPEVLADALGLSAVCLEGTMRQVHHEGWAELENGVVVLRRLDLIKALAA